MSFSTNVPNASQSPGVFPAQNQTNFARLKTIISTDHVFNNTADSATDGIHKKVSLQTRSSRPATLSGAASVLYTKLDADNVPQLRFYNGVLDRALTGFPRITASVNFNGTAAIGAQVIRSSTNVSSVDKTATGKYTINLSPASATANYTVSIVGMPTSVDAFCLGYIVGGPSYAGSVSTTQLFIEFVDPVTDQNIDVLAGMVTIMASI